MSTTQPAIEPGRSHARDEAVRRTISVEAIEWRASEASGEPKLQMRGNAAVFDRLSLDLGGFREKIAPGAFAAVLDRSPDVHLMWDHNSSLTLARTRSSKYRLDLTETEHGLAFRADVAPTSYAQDLRILMEAGVVDQASFAFTVERDEWVVDDQERVTRTILEVGELYDVTVTAQGAYPQTDTSVVEHFRTLARAAIKSGQLPAEAEAALNDVTPDEPAGESESRSDAGDDEQRTVTEEVSEETPGGESSRDDAGDEERATDKGLASLKAHTRTETELAKRRLLEASR